MIIETKRIIGVNGISIKPAAISLFSGVAAIIPAITVQDKNQLFHKKVRLYRKHSLRSEVRG